MGKLINIKPGPAVGSSPAVEKTIENIFLNLSKKNKRRVIDSIDPSDKPEIIFSKSAEDAGKRAHKFMSKRYLVVALSLIHI